MARIDKILDRMRRNPAEVRFADATKVCEHFFGERTGGGGSHAVFKTPWQGDPRVNIQRAKDGKAKAYQIRQVLAAIDRLKGDDNG